MTEVGTDIATTFISFWKRNEERKGEICEQKNEETLKFLLFSEHAKIKLNWDKKKQTLSSFPLRPLNAYLCHGTTNNPLSMNETI